MARANGSNWDYQYNLTDHLGNVRYVTNMNKTFEQRTDYFPFGLAHSTTANGLSKNKYLYNGKELQTELNFGWYDYHARMYDPSFGILGQVDPMVEKYFGISPYVYTLNNPILFVDPNGEDVYMYFHVTGEKDKPEDDAMFWAAALSRANYMLENGQIKDGDVHTFRAISDLGKLGDKVESVVKELSPNFGETAEFGLWSHGALDGPIGSTTTSGEHTLGKQMTPEGWGNIGFNFKTDGTARAMFFGCRTATNTDNGNSVIPWAQTVSGNVNMKNVEVWGQTMRSWPSLYPDASLTTSNMIQDIHSGPTYMVGSNKSFFNRVDRKMRKVHYAYPMGIYKNGKFIRNQYQSYRKR